MKNWLIYVGVSALLVTVSAALAGFWLATPDRQGVWIGLAAAWLVQAAAFGLLLSAARRKATLVVAGWTAGTLLRIMVLGLLAWLTLSGELALPPAPTLLALVAGLFGLLVLEPVFYRRAVEAA